MQSLEAANLQNQVYEGNDFSVSGTKIQNLY